MKFSTHIHVALRMTLTFHLVPPTGQNQNYFPILCFITKCLITKTNDITIVLSYTLCLVYVISTFYNAKLDGEHGKYICQTSAC